MKKLIKKSLLNVLMRIILTFIQNVYSKFKENNNVNSNKVLKSIILNKEKSLRNQDQETKNESLSSKFAKKYNKLEIQTKSSYFSKSHENKTIINNLKSEYLKDYNQQITDVNMMKKCKSDLEINHQNIAEKVFSPKRYYKCKAIIVCVLIVIGYVSLNNYLIMLVYYKSSSASLSSSSHFSSSSIKVKYLDTSLLFNMKPLASIFNKNINDNYNNHNNNQMKNDNYDIDEITYFYDAFHRSNETDYLVYIDAEDLEVANLKIEKILYPIENYKILNELYFDEVYNLTINSFESSNISVSKNVNNLRNKHKRPCVHPKLNPFDSDIIKFFKKEDELKCNPKTNWIYIENGRIRVSKAAINKHGTIVCAYIPL
jgi:hypothetical protein